jgi:hypothetical protein
MLEPQYSNIFASAHLITATPGCYGSGAASARTAGVVHAGPGMLMYGLETVASATAGATRLIFCWTTPDSVACTASGAGCSVATTSASAQGIIPINVGTGQNFSWYLSAATAVSLAHITASRPTQRFWISFLGANAVIPSAGYAGMIQS